MTPRLIEGDAGLLIVVDHASNHVPADIDLGIDPALLETHIAWDIGAWALAGALAERLGAAAIGANVSRLVIDLNREVDAVALIPAASDGNDISGNAGPDEKTRRARVDRFWTPWHDAIASRIDDKRTRLLVSLHSFTPRLQSEPHVMRPWQVGVLYNRDDRAARIALPLLRAGHVIVGDNLPYSGTLLNATMNRHGEANGLPYLGLEVRQDLIADVQGVERWAEVLAPLVEQVRDAMAQRDR